MKDVRKFVKCAVLSLILCLSSSAFTQTKDFKPIKLLWATFTVPGDVATDAMHMFADELTQKSGGKIKVEFSYGSSLAPAPQLYDKLVAGACDMAFFMPYDVPGVFPYTEILGLPCIFAEPEVMTKAMYDLFKKGYRDKAWDKVKLLWAYTATGAVIYWRDKPVTTVADFARKKIRVFTTMQATVMSALGAVPVFMSVGECYSAMEKGTVDGMWASYASCIPFKWYEVAKYCTEMNMFGGLNAAAMNLNSYNRLPPELRQIIDEMSYPNERYGIETARMAKNFALQGKKKFIEAGGKVVNLEPEEWTKLDSLLAPIWVKWIQDMESKGLRPKEALREFYFSVKAGKVEKPFVGYTPLGN